MILHDDRLSVVPRLTPRPTKFDHFKSNFELQQKNITLTKTGVNLNMVWKQANDPNPIDQSEPGVNPSTGSVIKKLGIPVSKLIGEQNTVSHRNENEKLDLQNYVNRMQPMQSILTIRPENGLPGHLQNGVSGHHVGNGHVPEQSAEHPSHRVKANSIESPPQLSNKSSEDELIDPVDSDGQTNGHGHNGHSTHNGEHSGSKDNGSVRTSVITENIDNVKVSHTNIIWGIWDVRRIWVYVEYGQLYGEFLMGK